MTTTAITKLDPELIKRARLLAGTTQKSSKVSYIKVNYDADIGIPKGNFILKLWNSDTEQYSDVDLGETFSAVILAHTKKCSQWDKDAGNNLYESNEFDTYQDKVELYSADELVDTGTYRELKTKNENLKLQIVLYLYIPDKEVYAKLFIKGGTIMAFGDYESSMVNMGGALQAFTTIFTNKKEKKGSVSYFLVKFAQGDYVNFEKMVELSQKVREGINIMRQRHVEVLPTVTGLPSAPPTDEEVENAQLDDLPF